MSKKFIIVEFNGNDRFEIYDSESVTGTRESGNTVICKADNNCTKNGIYRYEYTSRRIASAALNRLKVSKIF